MKNKILTSALVCAMAMSMCVPAMAAPFSCEVKGTYEAGGVADEVISYTYTSLDSISFKYSATDLGTWNPETHEYEGGGAGGGWTADGNTTTTITNHSNIAIDVSPVWAAEAGYEDVDLMVATSSDGSSDGKLDLPTAVGTEVEEAPEGTLSFNLQNGSLTDGNIDVKIGTITLNVEKDAN